LIDGDEDDKALLKEAEEILKEKPWPTLKS